MSRIGKMPVKLPKGVTVQLANGMLNVSGPKGQLSRKAPPAVTMKIEANAVEVQREGEGRQARAMHGLARALLQNMVKGVSSGFERVLEINGVGYRAEVKPNVLALSLGYSHPIEVMLPKGISAKVDKNSITLAGVDKEQLGQLAAVVREQRPPEPYKGKGIKRQDESIRRKVGKAGAS